MRDGRAVYNKMVRPKLDYHDALYVNMSVTLMQILELNERRQYLASSVMYTFVSLFLSVYSYNFFLGSTVFDAKSKKNKSCKSL